MHLHITRKKYSATYLFHISKHFLLYKCFSSGLRSAAVIVIASAGHDNAHRPQAVQFSVRHVLIGVDHGKLDFVHGLVQGIEW
jgi:hypothetical protein